MKKTLCSVPADSHSLLVERDEFVVSFRKCVLESFDNGLDLDNRKVFEKCAESDHVHNLGVFELVCSDFYCRNCNDCDVGAGRVLFDRGAFPDKNAAGFYFRLEFFKRRLVENDCRVISLNDRACDRFVADVT